MTPQSKNGNGYVRWQLWVGIAVPIAGLLATLVTLVFWVAGVAIEVSNQRVTTQQFSVRLDLTQQDIARGQLEISNQKAALNEIETQFCEADHLRNLMHATDLRWMSMLWEKTFAQRIPTDNAYYPTVCNRKR